MRGMPAQPETRVQGRARPRSSFQSERAGSDTASRSRIATVAGKPSPVDPGPSPPRTPMSGAFGGSCCMRAILGPWRGQNDGKAKCWRGHTVTTDPAMGEVGRVGRGIGRAGPRHRPVERPRLDGSGSPVRPREIDARICAVTVQHEEGLDVPSEEGRGPLICWSAAPRPGAEDPAHRCRLHRPVGAIDTWSISWQSRWAITSGPPPSRGGPSRGERSRLAADRSNP